MLDSAAIANDLSALPETWVAENVPLSLYTRFGIGGPAPLLVETPNEGSFMQAVALVRAGGMPWVVIGGGTNLVVSDAGFGGAVLRFTGKELAAVGNQVTAEAGAALQELVDFSIAHGLAGIHTMTGIPGSVGAAVYGNAGAYGRSIAQSVVRVRFFDGTEVREFGNAECEFRYRESRFKRNKEWVIFSAALELEPGNAEELSKTAAGILEVRNRKYPPTMKCAGSIFKNLILAELPEGLQAQVPEKVVIEGKVPSAYFLELVGAKGMKRGDIHVADYHANLIYNAGAGTAAQVVAIIGELKKRVRERFGLELEEEVQYVGL